MFASIGGRKNVFAIMWRMVFRRAVAETENVDDTLLNPYSDCYYRGVSYKNRDLRITSRSQSLDQSI